MRIAQILSGGDNGAAGHCLLLSRELADRGHEVSLFYGGGSKLEPSALRGINVVPTSLQRVRAELGRVNAIMNDLGIEVMHSHMSRAHAFGALQRIFWGRPAVATAHAQHLQLHWIFNDRVIAPSRAAASYMHRVNLVPRSRIVYIPNAVDLDRFPMVTPARRAAARAALALPAEALVVGTVGAISRRKGQLDLVLAVGRLARQGLDAWLVLVGGGDAAEDVRIDAAIAEFGLASRVIRTGWRDDIADLLGAFDIFAFASRRETGPLVVIEAMAAGLPVISSRVGSVPAFIAEGETGHIVGPGDVAAFAARIRDLAGDGPGRRAMGLAGRQRAGAHFALGDAVSRIESVLEDTARHGGRRHADAPASTSPEWLRP